MITAFRVVFRDAALNKPVDRGSFLDAVRAVRAVYPAVNFGEWSEMPPAGNGDRCSDLPFGIGERTLGNLFQLQLQRDEAVPLDAA
jgi:hypothetical protein